MSVVLPTYDRASVLSEAVRSVRAQTFQDWELIVVDDGSSDGTPDLAASWTDSRIRYVRLDDNVGASAARNAGLRRARGAYVAFLDSDDLWIPGKLEAQLAVFETSTDPLLGVVTCGAFEIGTGREPRSWRPRHRGRVLRDLLLGRRLGMGPPFLLCRTDVLEANGISFDPSLPARQDLDFAIRLLSLATLDYTPEEQLVIRHHGGQRISTSSRSVEAYQRIRTKYFWLFDGQPRYRSRHHVRTLIAHLAASSPEQAVEEGLKAVRADRRDPLAWSWLVAARAVSRYGMTPVTRAARAALFALTIGGRARRTRPPAVEKALRGVSPHAA